MRLHSLRIKNYKCLKDVTLTDLPPFCAFIGANGTGKSTLFDVLGFVQDHVLMGAEEAVERRGGFGAILSADAGDDKIEILLSFSSFKGDLEYRIELGGYTPFGFSCMEDVIKVNGVIAFDRSRYKEHKIHDAPAGVLIDFEDLLSDAEGAVSLKNFLLSLSVSNISVPSLRGPRPYGTAHRLDGSGGNLSHLALAIYEDHPSEFSKIVSAMMRSIPGLSRVALDRTSDDRIVLRFGDGAFKDPFLDRDVSDGTMKLFAYLVMLYSPWASSLLCVEEPENYLYPTIQRDLADEFRAYANRGGQVFVSTHSPDFLNALSVDEVVWLVKEDGFTKAVRAKDDPQVVAYMNEGDRMGYLWKEGFFKGVHP